MQNHAFLTSVSIGYECSVLLHGRFTPRNGWKGGWMGLRMIETLQRKKLYATAGIRTPDVNSVVHHYTLTSLPRIIRSH